MEVIQEYLAALWPSYPPRIWKIVIRYRSLPHLGAGPWYWLMNVFLSKSRFSIMDLSNFLKKTCYVFLRCCVPIYVLCLEEHQPWRGLCPVTSQLTRTGCIFTVQRAGSRSNTASSPCCCPWAVQYHSNPTRLMTLLWGPDKSCSAWLIPSPGISNMPPCCSVEKGP